jgi:hypothetical protein
MAGPPLVTGCSPCVTAVCLADPQCCTTEWDQNCINAVEVECGISCGCAHSVCVVGDALVSGCSQCASTVCSNDSSCCDPTLGWEPLCVSAAEQFCNVACP